VLLPELALVIICLFQLNPIVMAREQTAVCAEPNLHGVFLLFNVFDGQELAVRNQLAKVVSALDVVADQFSEAMLNHLIAIGADFWSKLAVPASPDFPSWSELGQVTHPIPSSTFDLLVHVRSDRFDVLFIAIQQVMKLLHGQAELVEQWFAFRYLDGRDLSGFYDTPDNPKGRSKRKAALIDDSGGMLAGGSYLLLLRHSFDAQGWSKLNLQEQQDLMGRTKLDGKLLPSAQRWTDSRADRASLEPLGHRLRLLWQNMPTADGKRQGLLALGCSAEPNDLLQYLQARLGDAQGYDLTLDFWPIEQGALFFAPSLNMLEKWR